MATVHNNDIKVHDILDFPAADERGRSRGLRCAFGRRTGRREVFAAIPFFRFIARWRTVRIFAWFSSAFADYHWVVPKFATRGVVGLENNARFPAATAGQFATIGPTITRGRSLAPLRRALAFGYVRGFTAGAYDNVVSDGARSPRMRRYKNYPTAAKR